MNLITIFTLQFMLTVLVYAVLVRWYLVPWLRDKPLHVALGILISPHAFRHLGLAFLVPGLTSETIPAGFANAAAYGDLASGLLAVIALFALRYLRRAAIPIIWVFSIVGIVDLVLALSHAGAIPHLGTAWLIPTFIVPGLLITHWLVLARLVDHARRRFPANGRKKVAKAGRIRPRCGCQPQA